MYLEQFGKSIVQNKTFISINSRLHVGNLQPCLSYLVTHIGDRNHINLVAVSQILYQVIQSLKEKILPCCCIHSLAGNS